MHTPSLFRCSRCGLSKPLAEFPPSKATNSSQWCRQCLREDARRRKGLAATERDVECECCGRRFHTTYTKAMFCSRDCKTKARNDARQAAIDEAKGVRRCVHCTASMPTTMRADAKFCSDECNSAAHAITRKMAKRAGVDKSDTLLSRAYIAERDGFRCHLCGGKVSMARKYPDPLSPSVDHVVPLSRGGTNDLANLKLAHLRCNLAKGDGANGEQLMMFG